MTDSAAFVPDLIRFEGAVSWLYRDVAGFPTVGVGFLVHDVDHVCTFPFYTQGRVSTRDEIVRDFHRVMALARDMPAARYRAPNEPRVELRDAEINVMTADKLAREYMPDIVRMFPAFEDFPFPAQQAVVDWIWNCGVSAMRNTEHLRPAIERQDWKAAAAACHRSTCRQERNDWCRDKFLEAAS